MPNTHISIEQKEILLDFIKARPKLYAGKFSPDFTLVQSRALWQELANILNSHPNGAKKEWSSWRKTWIDIKKNSKTKLAREKKYQKGTGGGPPKPINTDSFEIKVMELASPVCVTGNMEVTEPTVILDEEVIFEEMFPSNNELKTAESVQNLLLDHEYTASPSNENIDHLARESEIGTIKKNSSKMKTHLLPRCKSRITKTTRLKESMKNHSKMVEISERGLIDTNSYRNEKIQVLKEQRDELKKQTHIMENISISLCKIADIMGENF